MTRAHDRQKTLPTPATVHVVRVDPQRLVHAPHPHLPPLRRRLASRFAASRTGEEGGTRHILKFCSNSITAPTGFTASRTPNTVHVFF